MVKAITIPRPIDLSAEVDDSTLAYTSGGKGLKVKDDGITYAKLNSSAKGDITEVQVADQWNTTSTTYVDRTGLSVSVNVVSGRKYLVIASGSCASSDSGVGYMRLQANGTTLAVCEGGINKWVVFNMVGIFTATSTGSVTFKLQAKTNNASYAFNIGDDGTGNAMTSQIEVVDLKT